MVSKTVRTYLRVLVRLMREKIELDPPDQEPIENNNSNSVRYPLYSINTRTRTYSYVHIIMYTRIIVRFLFLVYQAHLSTAKTPNLLSWVESQTFWLSWENAVISVGVGAVVGREAFLTHIMDKKMRVNFIGFATGWGVNGRVR